MKIETKFDVDQEVFFMKDDKIANEVIAHINISVKMEYYMWYQEKTTITYCLKWEVISYEDYRFFATKKELLDSL